MTITTSLPFEFTRDQNIIEAPCCDFKTLLCIHFTFIMLFWKEQDTKDSHFYPVDDASFSLCQLHFLLMIKADNNHPTIWTCSFEESWVHFPQLFNINSQIHCRARKKYPPGFNSANRYVHPIGQLLHMLLSFSWQQVL